VILECRRAALGQIDQKHLDTIDTVLLQDAVECALRAIALIDRR